MKVTPAERELLGILRARTPKPTRFTILELQAIRDALRAALRNVKDGLLTHNLRPAKRAFQKVEAELAHHAGREPEPAPKPTCTHGFTSCSACPSCIAAGHTVEFEPEDEDDR